MSSGQKVAVSLFISILLFCGLAVAAFAGVFSVVENHFYQPVVEKSISKNIESIAAEEKEYFSILEKRFLNFAEDSATKSYISQRPTQSQVKARAEKQGKLFSETFGLKGIRIVDINGRYLHYSSFQGDILKRSANSITYKNYTDLNEIPFEKFAEKITFFADKGIFVFAIPLRAEGGNSESAKILFYCAADDFTRYLISKKTISLSNTGLLAEGSGFLFSVPVVGEKLIRDAVFEKWSNESPTSESMPKIEKLVSINNVDEYGNMTESNLILAYAQCENGLFVGEIYNDEILVFPNQIRILLLILVFTTIFLVFFFILSLKRDDMSVIQERVKKIQLSFITEYISKKDSGEKVLLPGQISARKNELNKEIKKNLGRKAKKHSAEVDELLEKSWDDIMNALGVRKIAAQNGDAASKEELRAILEEVISNSNFNVNVVSSGTAESAHPRSPPPVKKTAPKSVVEETEELEEVEDLDEVEPLDEVEEVEEPIEEGLAEDVEEAEPEEIEELEEVEDFDEVEEVEELSELEEAEDIEEVATEDVSEIDEDLAEIEPEVIKEFDEIEEAPLEENLEISPELEENFEEVDSVPEIEELDEKIAAPEKFDEVEPMDELSEEPVVEKKPTLDDMELPSEEKDTYSSQVDLSDFMDMPTPLNLNEENKKNVVEREESADDKIGFCGSPRKFYATSDDLLIPSRFEIFAMNFASLDESKGENGLLGIVVSPEPKKKKSYTKEEFSKSVKEALGEFAAELKSQEQKCAEAEEVENLKRSYNPKTSEKKIDLDDVLDNIEDVTNLEEVEEIEGIEELEDVEELKDVEELEDVEKIEDVEEIEDIDEVEDATDVEEIDSGEFISQNMPFGFTNWMSSGMVKLEKMGKQAEPTLEASAAIVVDEDGVFQINRNLDVASVKQDPSLKDLIDSVIR